MKQPKTCETCGENATRTWHNHGQHARGLQRVYVVYRGAFLWVCKTCAKNSARWKDYVNSLYNRAFDMSEITRVALERKAQTNSRLQQDRHVFVTYHDTKNVPGRFNTGKIGK